MAIEKYEYDLSDAALNRVAESIANQARLGNLSFAGLQMQIFESLKRVRIEAGKS